MPDMTSVPNETLTLKAVAAEARRPEPGLPAAARAPDMPAYPPAPAKSARHMVSDDQLQAIKAHRSGIEHPLLWASIGVCLGSATGSLSALSAFLRGGGLTVEGFVQNMCFFSSLLAALILMVIHLPRRRDFHRLVDGLRGREG